MTRGQIGVVSGMVFGHNIGQDPSVSNSNRLHVDIFRFFLISFRYVLWILLVLFGDFREVLNFEWLFFKLNRFIYKALRS